MIRRVMEPYFRAHGISGSQWGVLRVLSRSEPEGLHPSVLSERLLVRPPSATGVVSRLEKMGLVSRSSSQEDQRAKHVRLTTRGRTLVNRIVQEHSQRVQQLLSALSEEEQEQLRTLLERLSTHFEEMAELQEAEAVAVKERA
jgi:DNA-binding MarR family transcriptional regulator